MRMVGRARLVRRTWARGWMRVSNGGFNFILFHFKFFFFFLRVYVFGEKITYALQWPHHGA